ncbi:hypothetical protein HJC23_002751 [Cyclotella cryptica]|uniref:Ankyrin repeat protein n=1 Tax=Cyclotella cryptica TaxID=29204 RepID=A0ABD3PVX5_9STRA|eukprot:CCRYP_012395-RA/>CCRYP_012395-RA protein AED:0.00 eAED:0.00 QI:136/-1/1/1/-1/1/1/1294/864
MVERIQRLLGATSLGAENLKADVVPDKDKTSHLHQNQTVHEHHESFLEELARKECRMLPCREHRAGQPQNNFEGDLTSGIVNGLDRNHGTNNETEDDHVLEERRHFHLLQWSSDDDDDEDFDSEDYVTDDDFDNIDNDNGPHPNESDDESFGSDDDNSTFRGGGNRSFGQQSGWEDRTSMSVMQQQELRSLHVNPITSLLIGLANSENEPLIRADIDWHRITSCPDLSSFYPTTELQDPLGAKLLQGTLRMDPPLDAIEKILDAFPKSCLDMSGFFAACQFANPKTSRRVKSRGSRKLHPLLLKSQNKRSRLNPDESGGLNDHDMSSDDDGYVSEDSDVGEVVKLVMHRTICARRSSNIEWGMVAFLGDARTSAAHTKELLLHNPEALIDTKHGAFGVSPLDRMVSGNFIHGDTKAWAEKLRLALRAASFVRLAKEQQQQEAEAEGAMPDQSAGKEITLPKSFFAPYSQFLRTVNSFLSLNDMKKTDTLSTKRPRDLCLQSFYPYHELIRLLISPNFGGTKFGDAGFVNTLEACTNSDPNAFLRPDNEGNLPVHVALSSECNTALGIKGERRLIRYLLNLDKNVALCPENNGTGRLPLRMCIENGWPVYDIIIDAALSCDDISGLKPAFDTSDVTYRFKDHITQIMISNRPLLHDALNGRYHQRFGIHGARQLVKNIMSKIVQTHHCQSRLRSCLSSFVDPSGRTALHVALEHKWPVYDIIIQAKPLCLEARDPTKHGFFPFQIAACAFARKTRTSDDRTAFGMGTDCSHEVDMVDKDELLEGSMLFELIRESPLCITWGGSERRVSMPSLVREAQGDSACVVWSDSDITRVCPSSSQEEVARQQSEKKRRRSSNISGGSESTA